MSDNSDVTPELWAYLQGLTGLTPPITDPVETAIEFASFFPAGIEATDEDAAREAYPQAYDYLRAHLPVESLDAALQWLQLIPPEQYLASAQASVQMFVTQGYVSPPAVTIPGGPLAAPSAPIAGPSDGTPGFPPAGDGATAEVPEDYKQAIAVIVAHLPQPLWPMAQAWLTGAADYPGQAWQVVEVYRRDGFLTDPDGGRDVFGDGRIQAPGSTSMAADEAEFLHAPVPGHQAPEGGIWPDPQDTMDQGMAVLFGSGDMSSRGMKRPLGPSDVSTEPPARRQRTMTDPSVSAPPPDGSGVSGLADRIRDRGTGIPPDPSLSEMLQKGNAAAARDILWNPHSHDELWSIAQTAPGLLALLVDDRSLLERPADLVEAILASVPTEADSRTMADIRPRDGASDGPAASSIPLALGATDWLGDRKVKGTCKNRSQGQVERER